MQYLLTQQEYDDLVGNRQKMIEDCNKQLKETMNKFASSMEATLRDAIPRGHHQYAYNNLQDNLVLTAVKEAMRNCSIEVKP